MGLLSGIRKNVLVLGAISFLTDVSSEMIFPLLPLFLVNVLGAPMYVVGLIEGIAEGSADMLKMVSGWLSDRMGKRKPFILFGYGLSTITKPFFAIASMWQHVFLARFADRVGKGMRVSARDAMIAEITGKKARGKAFGLRKAMDSLGAVCGPLIAFLLLPVFMAGGNDLSSAYRMIFWIAVIPAAIAVFLVLFVKEKDRIKGKRRGKFAFKGRFRTLTYIGALFAVGNFSYAFFILRSQEIGLVLLLIPIAYMFYNLVYTALAMPAGMLSDKIGRKPVLALGYALFGMICIGFAFVPSPLLVFVLFGAYGIFKAIIKTVERAYVSDVTPGTGRGTALGIYEGAIGIAAFPASVIAGGLWGISIFGAPAAFFFSAFMSLVSIVLLFGLMK